MENLTSRVIKTENVNWQEFKFIQQENFKDFEPEAAHKLKASILGNNFTQPFYVWEDPEGTIFCLDGKHRTKMLEELIKEGHNIPYLLPATFMQCDSKKDAARLVTIYSSIYAKISQQGLFDFLKEYEIDFSSIKGEIDLPEFSFDRFEQKFDLYDIHNPDETEDEIVIVEEKDLVVKPGDYFIIGRHKLYCCGFEDIDKMNEMLANEKARIVLTDPPYNLKANEFTNKGESKFKDFAMGGGEMSDAQFVEFIEKIMTASSLYTVDGGIHYIFMDWRHAWHMTEASRKVYGSPEPKQLCVWNKDVMANGSFYRAKHELCFIFKSGKEKHLSHLELSDRTRPNVWNYPSGNSLSNPDRDQLKNHPTPKPVIMLADAILDTTNENDIVIDFFCGSGSTLIACEKTKRICYSTEIEPIYVQSIINRYLIHCSKNGITPVFEHVNGSLTINDFKNGNN